MAEKKNWEAYRRRYLPEQLASTRRKLVHLEREAERLGMSELLERPARSAEGCGK